MKKILLLTFAGVLALLPLALAQERPDHFKGKPSPTLEAALTNLTEYNAKLEALLKQDSLGPNELFQVHQLSYTLEMALEKLGQEQARLTALMEEVHLASERGDGKTVKASGQTYLNGVAPLTGRLPAPPISPDR